MFVLKYKFVLETHFVVQESKRVGLFFHRGGGAELPVEAHILRMLLPPPLSHTTAGSRAVVRDCTVRGIHLGRVAGDLGCLPPSAKDA